MIHAYRKPLDPSILVIEVPLAKIDTSGTGPYTIADDGDGWKVLWHRTWGIGATFNKESVAREAAATLNALVEVDNKV